MKKQLIAATSVIAACVLFVGIWSFSRAQSESVLTACVNRTGTMRLLDTTNPNNKCLRGETKISWNVQGQKGDKGDTGSPSWDENRIVQLENRILEIEHRLPKTIALWSNFTPTTDETVGEFIDVSGYTKATLHFDWQPGTLTHTCQYEYDYSDDGVAVSYNSSFLYFSPATCQGMVDIPLGAKYLRINAWTPPSGILNASLELIP